jgi:hypothetical protein
MVATILRFKGFAASGAVFTCRVGEKGPHHRTYFLFRNRRLTRYFM